MHPKIIVGTLLLLATIPAAAQTSAPPQDQAAVLRARKLGDAVGLMKVGKPQEAIAAIDPLLDEYAKFYADEKRAIFCANSPTETLAYLASVATKKTDAIAVDGNWCIALWARGFAMIDLKQVEQAIPYLEQAVAKSPMHAHYLSELAYAHQALKHWQVSLDLYKRAASAAEMEQGDNRKRQLGRAWRGIGFDQVELGRWDEAAAAYRKALEIDPNDAKAKGELEWIAKTRPKAN